jgi:hypothetical protein
MTTKKTARQLDKLIEAAHSAIEFTVQGTGEFPFDMLRYDKAWPATEEMSSLLSQTHNRVIFLKGLKTPTLGRWASFGWVVV